MKNNNPKIRFSNFKECWSKEKLGKVAPLRGGYAFKSNLFCEEGIPIIRISNINSNGNINGKFVYIKENPIYETYILKNNSTLIAMSGATTGKVATLREVKSKVYQNQRVGYFTKTDQINYEFLSTIVKSTFFKSKLKEILVAGAQPNISSKDIDNLEFFIPKNLEEQVKIGLFFKKLDYMIDLHQQELDALKQTKQGFLQKMFPKEGETVPEIRFLNFKECWSKEKLGKVAPLRGGYAFKSNLFCEEGIPIIRISNINANGNINGEFAYIQENPIYETYLLENNSTLIAMSGATTGKVATLREVKSKVYQNQRVGYFTKTDQINYEFLSTLVKSAFFKSKLKEILVAGAQPNISSKDIDNLEFFIPKNLEEQVKIGEFFRQLDELIELKEQELEALKQIKQGFLQKMFV